MKICFGGVLLLKIFNNIAVKVILFIIIIVFLIINIYINTYNKISENKNTTAFNDSVDQYNLSITEFLSSFESSIRMLSKNEMVQHVSDNPEKYYNSTLELFKTFQQSYSSTAFVYFTPNKKIFGINKLVSWPDTSKELSITNWLGTQRPWYTNAIKLNGEITWTKPYIDSTTKKLTITVSKMVIDKNNSFKGVVAIDIYLDDLSKKISSLKKVNEGDILIISRTNKKDFFIIDNLENKELTSVFTNNIINTLYSKNSGNLHISNKKMNYYISYTSNTATGWKVVGIIENQRLMKETKEIINNIFVGGVSLVFISIIIILYVIKQMGSTIQTLNSSINAIGEKTLTPQNEIMSLDITSEEIIFDKPTSNINILFEIETEKERINELIKNNSNFTVSNAKQVKTSITRLARYLTKLSLSLKCHQIQRVNINSFLIEIKDYINCLNEKSTSVELGNILIEIDKLIKTTINS